MAPFGRDNNKSSSRGNREGEWTGEGPEVPVFKAEMEFEPMTLQLFKYERAKFARHGKPLDINDWANSVIHLCYFKYLGIDLEDLRD
ncbi:hypothetical protein A3K70_00480 [Candidatus Bathyarchaeota archaeon RBG_16_48_13]|nr:MAG: hypothetical protein A3K70_00480 [Candidatus Bathyarchaeota archaeon RBG_16_48_13]